MKTLVAALALAAAAGAAPVFAADVGVSISIGEPGFYGQLDMGSAERPRLINTRPVLVERRYRNLAPIYLRVPAAQQRSWSRYCDRYNACTRPVYFVRDDWYSKVYAPRYRQAHSQRDERRDERNDRRDDNRNDRRDERDDRRGPGR